IQRSDGLFALRKNSGAGNLQRLPTHDPFRIFWRELETDLQRCGAIRTTLGEGAYYRRIFAVYLDERFGRDGTLRSGRARRRKICDGWANDFHDLYGLRTERVSEQSERIRSGHRRSICRTEWMFLGRHAASGTCD